MTSEEMEITGLIIKQFTSFLKKKIILLYFILYYLFFNFFKNFCYICLFGEGNNSNVVYVDLLD